MGTVADLAPLSGENRALVRSGLNLLRRPHRQGVLSLISAAGLKVADLTARQIGFTLGPRLNAAGRLDSALAALDLLLTDDLQTAGRLAQQLDNQNRERQALTQEIQELAEKLAWDETRSGLAALRRRPRFQPRRGRAGGLPPDRAPLPPGDRRPPGRTSHTRPPAAASLNSTSPTPWTSAPS